MSDDATGWLTPLQPFSALPLPWQPPFPGPFAFPFAWPGQPAAAKPAASMPAVMRASAEGRLFIIRHEGQKGVSNHLHHPSAGSGVTIGPGYDMKDRTRDDIAADLEAVDVPSAAAAAASAGAGLTGAPADAFCKANKHLLDLSDAQQSNLLGFIIGRYEKRVQRAVQVPLAQSQFDALVSFAYNPGGGWKAATHLINLHHDQAAMSVISNQVYSKHVKLKGLVNRRADEVRLYTHGLYK